MSFSGDVSKFIKKTNKNTLIIFKKSFFDMANGIIVDTPRDTGRLAGNWQTRINHFATGELDNVNRSAAINEAQEKANNLKLGDSISLINNLPYAEIIENGSVNRVPYGMVKINITKWRWNVRKAARSVR